VVRLQGVDHDRLVGVHARVWWWTLVGGLPGDTGAARRPRPGQDVVVEHAVAGPQVDRLTGADVRVVLLRMALHGEHADDRTARVPQQVDLALVEALPQVIGDREGVGNPAVQRDRGGRFQRGVGGAAA